MKRLMIAAALATALMTSYAASPGKIERVAEFKPPIRPRA